MSETMSADSVANNKYLVWSLNLEKLIKDAFKFSKPEQNLINKHVNTSLKIANIYIISTMTV
jgi:hypothetical protein